MYKKLLTVPLILFIFTALSAPAADAQSPVSFGIKGGLNFANIDGSANFSAFDRRNGVEVGAVAEFSFPMLPVGFETGIYYSQKGTSISVATPDQVSNGGLSGDLTYRLDYVKVPVLAKFWFGSPGLVEPHILLGPYGSYNINSEIAGSSEGTVDISDEVNDYDFGIIGGVGVDFNFGLSRFSLQGRYSYGLSDLFEESDAKSRVFSLVAGFTF
ncbi:MAG: PorT family protein [Balneolaceae bacterium]|nr:PorT family protein [Balneolaceae bacterium]MCH8549000.1 PorT family protein [Balneolaceae bacterium]